MPGVKPTFPKSALGATNYLLVLVAVAAAGTAFVSDGLGAFSPLPQPVRTVPATIPNNTISVNILFIVGLLFTRSAQRASRVLSTAESYRPWKAA